ARWLPPRLHRAVDRRLPAVTLVDGIVVDAFDGLVAYRHGNGIRVEREHDPAGRLVGLRTGTAAVDVAHWRFEYGAGRRIRAMETVGQGDPRPVPPAGTAAGA